MTTLTRWIALLAPALLGSPAFAAADTNRPNIVMILIDDLGYADLGCFGSKEHRTPQIDRLAAEGLRFTDFHSNGAVCSPTRAGLLTGRYPQRFGLEDAIGFVRNEGVPLAATMVSEVLHSGGYRTAVFGKWHVGHVEHYGPNDQGFDESRCSNNNPDYHSHVSRDGNVDWYHNQKLADEPGYLVDVVTHYSTRFILENKARPFFLYVPHLAGHFPYQGPADPPHRTTGRNWDGEDKNGPLPKSQQKRAFRQMVEAVDESVGKIVATLESAGLRDRTMIFVCSDNGGYLSVSDNGPYRGQKTDLTEGGHRVAGIANWPGRIKPGSTTAVTAMTFDLMPTFVAIAGVAPPPGLALDGVDLGGVLFRGETLAPRALFWRDIDQKAVRFGPWKLLVEASGKTLFNLDRDPGEARDLAADEPGRMRELTARLAAWESEVGLRAVKKQPPGK
ncbi:MAG: sulfatase [Opitutus sp.]|nr:sulfatase [Opitutus sp.]